MRIINFQTERMMLMEQNNCKNDKAYFTSREKPTKDIEIPYSSLKYITQKKNICERFYESLVNDLKLAFNEYHQGHIDPSSFADEVQFIGESMKSLCEDGEIRMILERAQLVILQKLTEDITNREKVESAPAASSGDENSGGVSEE